MSLPQHWFSTLAFVILVAICHQVTALPIEYCSDINTSSNNKNSSIYQSNGLCYSFCTSGYAFAILQDDGCWCSDYIPASTSSISNCNLGCPGYPPDNCGATNLYAYIALPNTPLGTEGQSPAAPSTTPPTTPLPTQVKTTPSPSPVTVYETITPNTPSLEFTFSSTPDSIILTVASTASTSSVLAQVTTSSPAKSSSTWTPTPVVSLETVTGEVRTVTVTPTAPPNSQSTTPVTKSKSSGSFGTGAAVGLTIGLVGLIGIICAILFFCYRRRRVNQAEEGLDGSRRGSSAGLGGPPVRTMSQNSRFVLNTDGHRVVENWETGDAPGSRGSKLVPVDPRLDPFSSVYKRGLAENRSRESFNTIRDDHDYSRRVHQQAPILRATNPDELDD